MALVCLVGVAMSQELNMDSLMQKYNCEKLPGALSAKLDVLEGRVATAQQKDAAFCAEEVAKLERIFDTSTSSLSTTRDASIAADRAKYAAAASASKAMYGSARLRDEAVHRTLSNADGLARGKKTSAHETERTVLDERDAAKSAVEAAAEILREANEAAAAATKEVEADQRPIKELEDGLAHAKYDEIKRTASNSAADGRTACDTLATDYDKTVMKAEEDIEHVQVTFDNIVATCSQHTAEVLDPERMPVEELKDSLLLLEVHESQSRLRNSASRRRARGLRHRVNCPLLRARRAAFPSATSLLELGNGIVVVDTKESKSEGADDGGKTLALGQGCLSKIGTILDEALQVAGHNRDASLEEAKVCCRGLFGAMQPGSSRTGRGTRR